jgi:hypothetical protein
MALVSGKEKRPRRLPRPFVPMKPIAVAAARTPHAGGLQPRSSSTFWLVHWGGSLHLRRLPYLLGFPMAASRRGQKAPALTATGVAPDSNRISLFQRLTIVSLHAEHDAAYSLSYCDYTTFPGKINSFSRYYRVFPAG